MHSPRSVHTLVVIGRILREPKNESKFDDNLNTFERDILNYGSTSRSLFFVYIPFRSKYVEISLETNSS
jgi:hypothetical protein